MNMRRTLAVIVALVVAAAAGAFFAMSRGGSDASASAAPQQPQPQQQQRPAGADFQQFEQCLQSHGVTLTPGQRPDFGDTTMQKAFAACRSYLPARPGREGDDDGRLGPPDEAPPDGTT